MGLVDDAIAYLTDVAENLGLEDDERESFIDSAMQRKGFKRVSSWADPDPEENGGGGGDFFAAKRKREGQSRQVGTAKRAASSGGAGWQYGN